MHTSTLAHLHAEPPIGPEAVELLGDGVYLKEVSLCGGASKDLISPPGLWPELCATSSHFHSFPMAACIP